MWAKLILAVIVGAIGFSLCRRGLILSDEGYLLMQAEEIAKGKVLYRDLDAFVAPGAWLALGALFSILEPSVIVSRIPALGCFVLTAWLLYRTTSILTDDRYSIVSVLIYLVLSVWAFPVWSFAFYSPWATCAALFAFMRLLDWHERDDLRILFEMGIWLGIAIAFKQNYGVYAAVGCGVAYLALDYEALPRELPFRVRRAIRAFPLVAFGAALPLIPILGYFIYHGALGDLLMALLVYPFERFAGEHGIPYLPLETFWDSTPLKGSARWTYGPMAMVGGFQLFAERALLQQTERLLALIYWFPPALIVGGALLSLRKRVSGGQLDGPLLAITICAAFYFLGVFPRADFNHLINVYPPILILGAAVTHRLMQVLSGFRPLQLALCAAALTVFAAYGQISFYWYQSLLHNLNSHVGGARGGVLIDPLSAGMYNYEVATLRELTEEGEPVLTLPGLSMLNFLADRPMPSRYYNLYAVHIAHDLGLEVAQQSESVQVRYAVTEANNFFSDDAGLRDYAPELVWYLRRTFKPNQMIAGGKHVIWERREEPLGDARIIDALKRCEGVANPFGKTAVQNNLLYRTLRHRYRQTKNARAASFLDRTTPCRVRVPSQALLSVGIEYDPPAELDEGTVIHAEIWAVSPTKEFHELEPLLQVELPIQVPTDWADPAGYEYHIDLSKFDGQNVDLEFRTKLLGSATSNELDMEGFTVVWVDPHIEFPPH